MKSTRLPRLTLASFSNRPQTNTTKSSGQITVFSRKPGLWNSSRVHLQASPDSSEPDICGAQVSHKVSLFQPGVPGAIVSGSFVRDPVFSTRSGRRPGQDILRECSMGPVQPAFQARRVPRWPVLITSGPEDQESGQSSESEQWSPGQDSLLVNRIFRGSPSTLSDSSPLLHPVVRVSGSTGQMMFFHREPGREKTSHGHPQVSPGSFPVPACGPRRDRPRFIYFGFCLWIAECWTNQFLSATQRLGTSRHTGLSCPWNPVRDDAALLVQPHASTRKSEPQSFGQEIFLGILRPHALRRDVQSIFCLALVLCAALSRVRGPTLQPLTPFLGQILGTKSTSPPPRTSRYRYVGSVAWHHPSRRSLAPRPRMPNFLPKRARSCSPARPSSPLSQVPGRWYHPVASCPFVRSRHVATSWVPAQWMEVPAAWDVVELLVAHNSCATLEQWTTSNCLITFLDGTGEPFFK